MEAPACASRAGVFLLAGSRLPGASSVSGCLRLFGIIEDWGSVWVEVA